MNKLFKSKTSKNKDADEKYSASVFSAANDDASTVDRFTRSASVYDGNASVLSEDSFLGESFDDLSSPTKAQRKITVENVKFVDKKEWKKNSDCNICKRKIDKMKGVNCHHCRICAYAICGSCSKKKVNGERVCDVCFLKAKTEAHGKRREEYIGLKEEEVVQANKKVHKNQEDFTDTRNKIAKITAEIEEAEKLTAKSIQTLQVSKDEVQSGLGKKKAIGDQLKFDIDKTKREIRDREERLRNMKTKISVLKLQVSQKKAMVDDKKEELENLKLTKAALEYRTKNPSESVVEDKASFVSKNYSLVSQDKSGKGGKGGKYNISLQPVNI